MNQPAQGCPRVWTLWLVRAVFALTVLNLCVGEILSIWMGKFRTDSFWWLVMSLPQVSIALLVVLICWAPSSRPDGLGLITVLLTLYGMVAAVAFMQWLPVAIGALVILALIVRPKGKLLIEASPPPAGWPRI